MLQVNAAIWNAIAKTGPLKTPIGQDLFPMNQEQQNQAHDREAKRLQAEGVDPEVALAYLEVAPLLAEREAIARYKDLHAQILDLSRTLPEVNSIQAAVLLATREHRLTQPQQDQLTSLLKSLNSLKKSDEPNEKPKPSL